MWGTHRAGRGAGEPSAPPHLESSDAALLAAVADGRVEALRLLHDRHAPWLRTRLAHRCPDPDAVDTALQDTFLALWRGAAARYRAETGDAGGWLWTIAIRRLISTLRGRGGRSAVPAREVTERDALTGSAEEAVLVGVEHGDLGSALGGLSPELRAVIQATVLDGLSVREAAGLLGIPEGTVKTRARRARAQLRERLA